MTGDKTIHGAITVNELCRRLQNAIAVAPMLQNVWVTAETSDVRISGGHCYLELLDKDDNGVTVARIRANIWASTWRQVSASFMAATGAPLTSGIRILAKVSAGYHPLYGMAVVITAVDPSYTMGDAIRRRNEILARLQQDGILTMNRQIAWKDVPMRVAVISAPGAAGYGDFINQLLSNKRLLNFKVRLFPAIMQGDRTVATVIAALDQISTQYNDWDCVVIIRGGGSTSDLAAFDNYELAAHVAQFPIPIIIGIGHERDITVLDYVANLRVKTPTAAAEWLIATATSALTRVENLGTRLYQLVTDRINGDRRQLAYMSALIPGAVNTALASCKGRLANISVSLGSLGPRYIAPRAARLDYLANMLATKPVDRLHHAKDRVDALSSLIDALSPTAVLRRGFSMTTDESGRVLTKAADIKPGQTLVTGFADGQVKSTVTRDNNQ